MSETTWKPIVWFVGAVKIKSEKKAVKLNLGYCTVGKGVAFVSVDTLHVLVIQSVDIHGDDTMTCGDANWCFNLKCPLNRAEPGKFKEYGVTTREELEKYHRFLERCAEELRKIYGEEIFKERSGFIYFKDAPIEVNPSLES
ncbi:MAG: hypothetical protein QW794_04350 [Thermosphaera sp.]